MHVSQVIMLYTLNCMLTVSKAGGGNVDFWFDSAITLLGELGQIPTPLIFGDFFFSV